MLMCLQPTVNIGERKKSTKMQNCGRKRRTDWVEKTRTGELKVQSRICIEADGREGSKETGVGREIKIQTDCRRE